MKDSAIIENLKQIMSQRGISQRDLAKMLDKDETAVSRWFNGKVGISEASLTQIESVLAVKLDKKRIRH